MPRPDEIGFDPGRADRVERFFQRVLVHAKGRWARQPFILAPWQRDEIIRPLFGTVRYDAQLGDWVRQYRLAWIELARKQGKSELLAGIALYLLAADDEESPEVYGAARDREQAGLVYAVAKRMVELSPVLSGVLRPLDGTKRILNPRNDGCYKVIAADAAGNLGQNPSGIVLDEVIAQPNRDLWDALQTGMGARDEPLMVAATTAGNDAASFAAEEHLYCERVAASPSLDPTRLVCLHNTPMDADWRDEANWYHANPALGSYLSLSVLRGEAREAEVSLAKQNRFRQFRLNQWVRQVTRWLDLQLWDENAGMVIEDQLAGRPCFAGLDLASTADLTAWVLVFPSAPEAPDGPVEVLARTFLPRGAVERRGPMRDRLAEWVLEGWLEVTEGDVLDYDAVRARIDADAHRFDLRSVGYDRWNANEVVSWGTERGLAMEGLAQTTTVLSAPAKELERLLGQRRLAHGGNPILRWAADNVTVLTDSSGGIKPDKRHSSEKIDPVVALVMALQRMMAEPASRVVAEIVHSGA